MAYAPGTNGAVLAAACAVRYPRGPSLLPRFLNLPFPLFSSLRLSPPPFSPRIYFLILFFLLVTMIHSRADRCIIEMIMVSSVAG